MPSPTAGPKSVAQKMGIKAGSRTHFVNAPESVVASLQLPAIERMDALGDGVFDYIHLFATTQAELSDVFPKLTPQLGAGGTLWVSWPKGKRLGSDLTLPRVIDIGYRNGLVESTCLRVDDTWAGLKFTHPKPGKVYNNSYGTLPGA